jgi:hypothetical protein
VAYLPVVDRSQVLAQVQSAIAVNLGLVEDEATILPEMTLGDLAITAFELFPILLRAEDKLGANLDFVRIVERLREAGAPDLLGDLTVGDVTAIVEEQLALSSA